MPLPLRLSPPFRLGPTDLPGAEGHAAPASVRAAVDGMLAAGCPRAKLVLGLPFYGRSLEQPGRVATYDELLRLRATREAAGERDTRDDRVGEFAYESPRGAARKVELAAALGLAGVMVWEVGQDARPAEARGGLLLGALAEAAAASSVGWVPGREDPTRLAAVTGSERTAVGGERDELR